MPDWKPIIFSGRASYKLAKTVCELLGLKLGDLVIQEFADAEPYFKIENPQDLESKDVFVIQTTSEPVARNYFDLIGILGAAREYHPQKIVAVLPFMGFRRQERAVEPGEAIMAKQMAKIIQTAGATEVILCDPHYSGIGDFFDIPVRILNTNPLFIDHLKWNIENIKECAVATPDSGRKGMAADFAERLGVSLIEGVKLRPDHDQSKAIGLEGDCLGRYVLIREDEINTARTIKETVHLLKQKGAKKISIVCTHAVLSGGAIQVIKSAEDLEKVWVSDTIYLPWEKRIDKIEVVSVAPLFAEEIKKICGLE